MGTPQTRLPALSFRRYFPPAQDQADFGVVWEREKGLPNLWIPKKIQRVEKIPVLASGKLDLAACKELALGA